MKRKLLIALLAVVGCFVCIFGLAACADGGSNNGDGGSTGGNETHKHTYSEDWTYDEMYHWHEATCEHKNEISGKSEHSFKNNVCSVCGYKLIPSEGLEYKLNGTAYTVTGIGTCKDTDIVIPAEYGEGIPVTGIGETAFSRCNTLTSIIIPDNVTSIGEYAFSFCSALTSIEIPGGVTNIEKNVFYGCSSLTSIEIPDGVTSIRDYAFSSCNALTSIKIPDSMTSIGNNAFYQCSSLTSIEIPDSVTSIGDYAFSSCSALTSINFNGTQEQWNAIKKGSLWNYNTGDYTIHCTDGDIVKED